MIKPGRGGGLGKYLSYLERVGVLRDAGRMAAADKALETYMALPESASSDAADVEKSVQLFIDKMRKERKNAPVVRPVPGVLKNDSRLPGEISCAATLQPSICLASYLMYGRTGQHQETVARAIRLPLAFQRA